MNHLAPFAILLCFTLVLPSAPAAAKPNVVILLADDLGWGDLSINKGSIPTPQIDRFFQNSVRLDNFMVWAVCSPTRAMLLTGRHPYRVGTGPETGGELAAAETTIAEGFKAGGYRTGIFGKWHNGDDPDTPAFRSAFAEAFKDMPNKKLVGGLGVNEHGFDEAWIYYGGGADYFTRRTVQNRGPVSWWHNREFRPQDAGYTEDFIVQHAIEFIRDNRDTPFFCYVPFHIVHSPLQAKEADLKRVDPAVTDETKRVYAAMVQALDANVGMILSELDRHGLQDNTIVLFTSDNGANKDGSNLPFKGGKHSIYEGGTHVPAAIRWPAGKLAGGRHWDGLCGALDLFPTLMAMAGLPMPEARPLDGKNIWPALRDGTASPVESCYWSWHAEDAIRTADWRLHRYFDHVELYDVRNDIGEASNVADTHPEQVKALTAQMDAWAASLGAALTHQPPPKTLDAEPAPEGQVLEISVTATPASKPRDILVVPFAGFQGFQYATDYVEYDIAATPATQPGSFFYSPYSGNQDGTGKPDFKRGEGIDQFGREQVTCPPIQGTPGSWEHRIIGLAGSAPGPLGRHGMVFKGGKPGTRTVYIDNLRIRHADGSTSPIWLEASDTRARKIADSAAFTNITIRPVPATAVGSR